MAAINRHSKSGGQGQGQKWCRNEKRISLYIRDGLACCYCGSGIEHGVKLTLDHLLPHSHGGSNDQTNLVTCCHRCNSARGNRDWREFAENTAGYLNHGVTGDAIAAHITATAQRPLDIKAAQALIDARGGFSKALYN